MGEQEFIMQTQYQKILELNSDGEWHCQTEYWALFIRSPHKRRAELSKTGKYLFQDRPCEHGHKNVKDYKMYEIVAERVFSFLRELGCAFHYYEATK